MTNVKPQHMRCAQKVDEGLRQGRQSGLEGHMVALLQEMKLGKDSAKSFEDLKALSMKVQKAEVPCFEENPDPDMRQTCNAAAEEKRARRAEMLKPIAPKSIDCSLQNFGAEHASLKVAGLGFNKETQQEIIASIRDLAHSQPTFKSVKFWGRINGLNADYWIAETEMKGTGDKDEGADCDVRGTGANKCTYFYKQSLCDSWTQLADVNPDRLKCLKETGRNKMLSGDPEKICYSVAGEGMPTTREKNLLRCMIARISAATHVCPSGALAPEENEDGEPTGNLIVPEDYAAPALGDVAGLDAWVHCKPCLLNNGRTKYRDLGEPAEDASEEAIAAHEAAVAAQDAEKEACPEVEILSGVQVGEEGEFQPWSIRTVGDPSEYTFDTPKKYGVVKLTSNVWPGAATVYSESTGYTSIYVGNGCKAGVAPFKTLYTNPAEDADPKVVPSMFQTEPEECAEQMEPYPLESPVASDGGDEAAVAEE